MGTAVENLWKEYSEIKILLEQSEELSLLSNYTNTMIKVLILSCRNFFKCEMTDVLIASHIKPWRKSTNKERLDRYNGLLLLPNYDKLFDKGLIYFEDNGKIIISPLIKEEEYKVLGISPNDELFKVYPKNKPYLEEHRRIIFHQK